MDQTLTTEQKNAGVRIERTTDKTGSRTYSTPVTSDTLKPIKPVVLPPTKPQTEASGLEAMIGSGNASIKTEADRLRQERIDAQTAAKDDLSSLMSDITNTNSDIANVENTVDRSAEDKARKEADRLTSEIEAEQLSNRRRIELLQKTNPQGKSTEGLTGEINRINRDSVSHQADLAILQNSALRNYETANAIADRQVQLKLEPLKANLENLKFFYENNKEDFNKEDDRLYTEQIKKADAELKKQEDLENQIKDIKLLAAKNGATADILSQLGEATTFDEALKFAGSYLSTPNTSVVKLDNGSTLLIDTRTGRTIKNFGGGSGDSELPTGTPEQVKSLVGIGTLVGNFSSVNGQKMFLKNLNDLAVKGDERGIAEKVIGQTLANIPDPDQRKKATGGFLLSQQLTGLQKLLDEYEAGGGETNIFRGNVQAIQQKVGLVGDPKLANLGTQILNQLDNLARTRTGAVISPSEERLYARLLPGIGKVGDLNREVISGLKTSIMVDVENNLRYNITSDGVDILKSTLPEIFDYDDNFLGSFSSPTEGMSNGLFFNTLPQ